MRRVLALGAMICLAASTATAAGEPGGYEFAIDLYRQVAATVPGTGNVCISPYSARVILALTREGAARETRDQMEAALRLAPGERPRSLADTLGSGFTLETANAVWVEKELDLRPAFEGIAKEAYGAEAHKTDFAFSPDESRTKINDWVSERTHEKIQDLFAPGTIRDLTRVVLANAVYLDAKWATQFKGHATHDQEFRLETGIAIRVPTMSMTHELPYAETDEAQMLELPYAGGGEIGMLVVLPKVGAAESPGAALARLEEQLSGANLQTWVSSLEGRSVEVHLPRFTITTPSVVLNEPLQALGMVDAFDFEKADFSAMVAIKPVAITHVVQKAFIRVDEEGTEAAAATGVSVEVLSVNPMESDRLIFRADHPFLYAIVDKQAGEVLFLGKVLDPR